MLGSAGVDQGAAMTLMNAADTNQDGLISWEEFMRLNNWQGPFPLQIKATLVANLVESNSHELLNPQVVRHGFAGSSLDDAIFD